MSDHTEPLKVKPADLPNSGEVFEGKYKVEDMIGAGGFARVYRATALNLGRTVALKVLVPELPAPYLYDDSLVQRFEREARLVSELRSPHTVTVYDYGRAENGLLFMVFEYVDGRTLDRLIREEGAIEPKRVRHILEQTLKSLHEAHRVGILHRDIKPANIIVFDYMDDRDQVKVLDFGIAKQWGQDDSNPEAPVLTQDGKIMGTPRYMSPEQLVGEQLGPPTDIYSLGLVAYELTAGVAAVPFRDRSQIVRRHLSPDPLHLPEQLAAPVWLRTVIHKMLEKDHRHRFQHAAEVLDAFRRLAATAAELDPSVDMTRQEGAAQSGPHTAPGLPTPGQYGSYPPQTPQQVAQYQPQGPGGQYPHPGQSGQYPPPAAQSGQYPPPAQSGQYPGPHGDPYGSGQYGVPGSGPHTPYAQQPQYTPPGGHPQPGYPPQNPYDSGHHPRPPGPYDSGIQHPAPHGSSPPFRYDSAQLQQFTPTGGMAPPVKTLIRCNAAPDRLEIDVPMRPTATNVWLAVGAGLAFVFVFFSFGWVGRAIAAGLVVWALSLLFRSYSLVAELRGNYDVAASIVAFERHKKGPLSSLDRLEVIVEDDGEGAMLHAVTREGNHLLADGWPRAELEWVAEQANAWIVQSRSVSGSISGPYTPMHGIARTPPGGM